LVDGLGGVQLDVQRRLPVSSAGSGPGGQQRAIRAGRQEVDGRTALDFISFPGSTSVLDTDLMHRQLQLLGALGTAALQTQTGFRIPTLVNSLSPQISTNFPYDQVPELARVVSGLGTVKVERVVLGDGDGAVMEYGTNILVPDWQRTAAVAHRLFPDTWLRAGPGIAVLNGSGVTGQAGSLADWLRQAGLRVRHIGSADSFGYAHTLVVVSPSAGSTTRTTARAVAALLQVPMVVSRRGREPAPVVVIIGHDYQDPNQN
jgi:hypothetical protein